MVGLTTVLTSSQFDTGKKLAAVAFVSLLGVAISSISLVVERRAISHFELLLKRGVAIETDLGVQGQLTLGSQTMLRRSPGSETSTMHLLFAITLLFWLAAPYVIWRL